jgi:hypothetical protein
MKTSKLLMMSITFLALTVASILSLLLFFTPLEQEGYSQMVLEGPEIENNTTTSTTQEHIRKEDALMNSLLQLGDFSTALVAYHGNQTVIVLEGPATEFQPYQGTVNDVAWLHGFDTLVYEYTQQGELIIILVEQQLQQQQWWY